MTPVILCLGMMASCNIRKEGCLDIVALNFDLDAEKACNTCCDYPPVTIVISHKWDDRNFTTEDTLYDINAMPYKIRDLRYVLSSFAWKGLDGKEYTIDSTEIQCGQEKVLYTPDLLLIESKRFSYILDSVRVFPAVDTIQFTFGLPSRLDCVDATEENIPLILSDNSAIWDSTLQARATVRMVLQRDLEVENLDTLFIHYRRQLILPFQYEFVPGKENRLPVTVNYAQWFVEADKNDPGSFAGSFMEHLEGSIFQTP